MKDKVLYLILGILIGAIITSLIFIFVINKNEMPQDFEGKMEGRERQEMGNMVMPEDGQRPEMGEEKRPNRDFTNTSDEL